MFDHIGLHVANLDASVRFYTALLAPLGHTASSVDLSGAGLGPPGAPALWLYADGSTRGPSVHVAFRAMDHQAVDQCHAAGIAAGGQDNGPPGPRPGYSPTYYAAFLLDPDGNNVEAVCLS